MIYVMMIFCLIGMFYFATRLFLLKKSIKDTRMQLQEINRNLEENRVVKLSVPGKELEKLLVAINVSLKGIRQERIAFTNREKEFKQQIENISHDLRTPLTSMIGYLKIMDTDPLNEEEQEDLRTVLKKAERLQELITQFYDFSRLTAQDYPLELENIDVAKVLRESLADAYAELSKRQLEVTAELPEDAVYIPGDGKALQRVFQNLLQNAAKYAVSFFWISMKEEEEWICTCFQNDVEDIGERDIEQFFDRFYTQDRSRSSGSTGLGLTIAKEFVEKMGGSIEAKLEDRRLYLLLRLRKY